MKKNNTILNSFSYLFSANIMIQFIGIFTLSYFTRIFSASDIALIPTSMMLGGISTLIFNFGVFPYIIKYIPTLKKKNIKEASRILYTCFLLILLSSVIYSSITFYISNYISIWIFSTSSYSLHIKYLSIGFIFFGLFSFLNHTLKSLNQFKLSSKISILKNIIKALSTILLYFYGYGAWSIVYAFIISNSISFLLLLYGIYNSGIRFYGFANIFDIISESYPFYIEAYVNYIKNQGDSLIVTSLLGSNSLVIYYISKKIYLFLYNSFSSLSIILKTELSSLIDDVKNYNIKLNEISLMFSFIVIPLNLLFISFVPFVLGIIAGPKFYDAVFIGTILSFIPLITFAGDINWGINIFLLGNSMLRLKISFYSVSILLILSYFLGIIYSLLGIIVGMLLASIFRLLYSIKLSKGIGIKSHFKITNNIIVNLYLFTICIANLNLSLFYFDYVYVIFFNFTSIVFLVILINLVIGDRYYQIINKLLKINIKNPINYILRK